MKHVLGTGVSAVLASILLIGCATTPPPPGFHYETSSVGKRMERKLVKDREPGDWITPSSTPPTGLDEPGPGKHYEYQYRGKWTTKVIVKDVEVNYVPIEWLDVTEGERCSKCHWEYVTVGKRSVIKWFCDAKVHGSKEGAQN
jgi:hypothetical protein